MMDFFRCWSGEDEQQDGELIPVGCEEGGPIVIE